MIRRGRRRERRRKWRRDICRDDGKRRKTEEDVDKVGVRRQTYCVWAEPTSLGHTRHSDWHSSHLNFDPTPAHCRHFEVCVSWRSSFPRRCQPSVDFVSAKTFSSFKTRRTLESRVNGGNPCKCLKVIYKQFHTLTYCTCLESNNNTAEFLYVNFKPAKARWMDLL